MTARRSCVVSETMRLPVLVLFAACSSPAIGSSTRAVARSPVMVPSATVPAVTVTAPSAMPSVVMVAPSPKVVLHLGDSMVGGYGGLTKALETRFKDLGAQFVRDWEVSVSIATFDREHRLQDLIAKHSPDVIILTLGANDLTVPYPTSLAPFVRSLAHKMGANDRACFWMTPPTIGKPDTGIVDVIKQNAAPCKVFDASHMQIARAGDGIHPTNRGGSDWADAFFAFYRGAGPATPTQGMATE